MPQNYTTGTVSVSNGNTIVTGSGTAWELSLVTGGLFCCDGYSVPIASVESDTSLTLALPWSDATSPGRPYAIFRETAQAASAVTANDRLAEVAGRLRSDSVNALAGLTLAADKLPYGNGPGTMGLIDFPAASRTQIAAGLGNAGTRTMQTANLDSTIGRVMGVGAFGLGGTDGVLPTGTNLNSLNATQIINPLDSLPIAWDANLGTYPLGVHWQRSSTVQAQFAIGFNGTAGFRSKDGAGTWQAWRKIFHSYNVLGTVGRSGGIPTGSLFERGSNGNGEYARFTDGTQICQRVLSVGTVMVAQGALFSGNAPTTWTFPAAFIATPTVFGADTSSYNVFMQAGPASTGSADIMPFSWTSIGSARNALVTAIGRWF
jgi:hypothetical protein